MKRALITGVRGQDGSYLAEFLLSQGYQVFGTTRWIDQGLFIHGTECDGVPEDVVVHGMNLHDAMSVEIVIRKTTPDEIYNLGAQTFVPPSWTQPTETIDVNTNGLVRILQAVEKIGLPCKVYQASTSEMFGGVTGECDESTRMRPVTPYAIAKYAAHNLCEAYRRKGMYVVSGIAFNHESPRRGYEMVTRKITNAVAEWKVFPEHRRTLKLGNMEALKDWGYAKEYVEAMHASLQQTEPQDYVLGTGNLTSVRGFLHYALTAVGMDPEQTEKELVETSQAMLRPNEVQPSFANPKKAEQVLGWKSTTRVGELAKLMVEADIERLTGTREVSTIS